MPTQDPTERRRHPRLILKAFGFKAPCRYQVDAAETQALLIDISSGGARLKSRGNPPPAKGVRIVLDAMLPSAPVAMDRIAATVCWIRDMEFGVAFTPELALGVSDLQTLLSPQG